MEGQFISDWLPFRYLRTFLRALPHSQERHALQAFGNLNPSNVQTFANRF